MTLEQFQRPHGLPGVCLRDDAGAVICAASIAFLEWLHRTRQPAGRLDGALLRLFSLWRERDTGHPFASLEDTARMVDAEQRAGIARRNASVDNEYIAGGHLVADADDIEPLEGA